MASGNRCKQKIARCTVSVAVKNTPANYADKPKSIIDSVIGKTMVAKRITTANESVPARMAPSMRDRTRRVK